MHARIKQTRGLLWGLTAATAEGAWTLLLLTEGSALEHLAGERVVAARGGACRKTTWLRVKVAEQCVPLAAGVSLRSSPAAAPRIAPGSNQADPWGWRSGRVDCPRPRRGAVFRLLVASVLARVGGVSGVEPTRPILPTRPPPKRSDGTARPGSERSGRAPPPAVLTRVGVEPGALLPLVGARDAVGGARALLQPGEGERAWATERGGERERKRTREKEKA